MKNRQIAYLWMPYFGTMVARQVSGASEDRPLVLLDEQGRVFSADAQATQAGVAANMSERQATARCPYALFDAAARYPLFEAQEQLRRHIEQFTDRWQADGAGSAYLEASDVGAEDALLQWCQALANSIRRLGWPPALGATGSKFGASVAGRKAGKNTALLLGLPAQRAFLASQPIAFLPLDADALIRLRHLGIRSLGQYAQLPVSGVLARFGEVGRTAQRWAQGLDDRPVVPAWEAPEVSGRLEFETPSDDWDRLMGALMQRASRLLAPLRGELQAVGWVRLTVTRADRRTVTGSYTFPQPVTADAPIRFGMLTALQTVPWDGQPAAEVTLTLGGICDMPVRQMSLFDAGMWLPDGQPDATAASRAELEALLNRLALRYGADVFRMVALDDPDHPLPERRTGWRRFSDGTP